MKKNIFLIELILIFNIMISSAQADESNFDYVCQYFEQLDKLATVETMSNIQRNKFILDKINRNLHQTSNARAAWMAIDSAVADIRYELFKSAAESVINTQWQCSAMLTWASKTGEF